MPGGGHLYIIGAAAGTGRTRQAQAARLQAAEQDQTGRLRPASQLSHLHLSIINLLTDNPPDN